MHIDRQRAGIFRVTLSGYELAALVSAARWIVDGTKGDLSDEALAQLKQVVENYDKAFAKSERLTSSTPGVKTSLAGSEWIDEPGRH